jgi:hypothetical protein
MVLNGTLEKVPHMMVLAMVVFQGLVLVLLPVLVPG